MRAKVVLPTLAIALFARTAAAEDLNLTWQAPAGCPSGKEVHDAALRSARSDVARQPLEADVHVDKGASWSVTIRTKRAGITSAERHLEATSCTALAEATAVILALALIPPEDPAPAPAPAPALAPAPAPALALAPAPAPAPSPSDADRPTLPDPHSHPFAASASLATDGTTLPSAAVGGRAGLAWTPSRARVELAGSFFSSQTKTTGTSAAGATFTLLVAGARGCWAIVRSAVELSPCLGLDAQIVKARGFGAAQNYDASAAWMSAAGGALVRVPVTSWLALRGDADAIVPFSRPRFVVEGDGAVHQAPAFGVRAGIGAEILFL